MTLLANKLSSSKNRPAQEEAACEKDELGGNGLAKEEAAREKDWLEEKQG